MSNPDRIPDELLSAYLDGESPSDELQQVNRALEQDDQTRASLDELSRLRQQIRELPKYALPDEFTRRVVAQCDSPPFRKSKPLANRQLTLGALALAATVLVAVILARPWEAGEPQQVASTPATTAPADALSATAVTPRALRLDTDERSRDLQEELGAQADAELESFAAPSNELSASPVPRAPEAAAPVLSDAARVDLYLNESQLQQFSQQLADQDDARRPYLYWQEVPASDTNAGSPTRQQQPAGQDSTRFVVLEGTAAEIAIEMQQVQAESARVTILQSDLQPAQLGLLSISGVQHREFSDSATPALVPGVAADPTGGRGRSATLQQKSREQLAARAADVAEQGVDPAAPAPSTATQVQGRDRRLLRSAAAGATTSKQLAAEPRYRIILVPHAEEP